MKNIVIILVFTFFQRGANAQQKILDKPSIFLNSVLVEKKIIDGKEWFEYNYKDKKIENDIYSIYSVTLTDFSVNNYQNDILRPESDFTYGKHKGFISKGIFYKNFKTGLWKTTYKKAVVKSENWNNGLITGEYKVYNTNKKLLYETNFVNGNGKYKDYYYKTSILKLEGNYENGKKQGEWCNYDEQGKLLKKEYFKEGQLVN